MNQIKPLISQLTCTLVLDLGKAVVIFQAVRVEQRAGLDPLAGHNLFHRELHLLQV